MIPKTYVVQQSEYKVLQELRRNGIQMEQITKDIVLNVSSYVFEDFKTMKNPYEGHYPHYETKLRSESMEVQLLTGDYLVHTKQAGVKYILETLEPKATESFLN